jgi:hypothetical protein
MSIRLVAIAEVILLVALVLAIIWVVKPMNAFRLEMALRVGAAAIVFGSAWIHGDPARRLGLRLDNFAEAFLRVLPGSVGAAAMCAAIGWFFHSVVLPQDVALRLAYYLGWAALQQYALQSVVLLRLQDIGLGRRAPLAAATLFSAVHAPNPGLMILTFFGGLLWCTTFNRHPNLAAVAISHAVLAVVAVTTLPLAITGDLDIGPAYSGSV